ncbi:MAG: long-chain fatty acid--CoA ligase, partial [Comamonadaceae bacterium]
MNDQDVPDTIGGALALACARYPDRPFLAVPASEQRDHDRAGRSLSYAQVAREVDVLAAHYRRQGYGVGHRVGLLLENRLEHVLHKFALNATGACVVPLNPDATARELAYIIDHAHLDACVFLAGRRGDWDAALQASTAKPACIALETFPQSLAPARTPATDFSPTASSAATVLYTSGTTGKPKGCVLSHGYELASGRAYLERGGMATFREEGERIYNPLPLYHVNASVLSLFAALLSGSCQIQADRFHPTRWWREVVDSGATVVHYLGVMVQMLLSLDRTDLETMHGVRFGIGAGIEPQVHAACETRFGFPLLEIWGMTEMVRILVDCHPPRDVG